MVALATTWRNVAVLQFMVTQMTTQTSAAGNKTPRLGQEILEVIVSSFLPSHEFSVDADTLRGNPLVVARLLTENPWEKATLAEIYARDVIGGASKKDRTSHWANIWKTVPRPQLTQPTIFIESGSTCLCVSELLRRFYAEHHNDLHPFRLGTNNHLTAWLFQNRHRHLNVPENSHFPELVPYLFAGRLESKYHGIFPFYRKRKGEYTQEERDGYAQLRLSLASSDLLLLAASRLSLIYGPFVGSRENAIFKNACYNACVPPIGVTPQKELHLFITVQKLVAHVEPQLAPDDQNGDASAGDEFHTWKEELHKLHIQECFPAFDLPGEGVGHSRQQHSLIRSPFSLDLVPESSQRLRDGTSAVEIGEGRIRICHTWQELFTKAFLTVKVFVAFNGDFGNSNPNYHWIRTEVEHARSYFADKQVRIDLSEVGRLKPPDNPNYFSLALIQISPAQ
jgi:hypothetical protein